MSVRKILFVTGTRAEYGLLSGLMRRVADDPQLQIQIVATGAHLSPEFGLTWRHIEADGFRVDKKVEMLVSSDTPTGACKSMGLAMAGLADAYADLAPHIVVILGDRYEALCAAAAACVFGLPVAHIHGGEITEGAIDEAFRHSITKMSHLHFASAEPHRRRIIQLGEDPERVFDVGALGVENIRRLELMDRAALEASLGVTLPPRFFLATFHPPTIGLDGPREAELQAREMLAALDEEMEETPDLGVILTRANSDAAGRAVNRVLDEYQAASGGRVMILDSIGQTRFLSLMRLAEVVIGNSSSGILEAPALGLPTVNIGDRQKGRLRPASVIDAEPEKRLIRKALREALAKEFRDMARATRSPYEKDGTSASIVQILKSASLSNILMKKFHDAPPS